MRATRLDGAVVEPGIAGVPLDDPMARAGDGLIETMRARNGVIVHLEHHLARLQRSAEMLDMARIGNLDDLRADLAAVVADAGEPDLRVRACVSAGGMRWVEAVPCPAISPAPRIAGAITVVGGWIPSRWLGEHKTASRAHLTYAERLARRQGAEVALLLDAASAMGEATTAAVCVVADGEVRTTPVRGLVPGVGMRVLRSLMPEIAERPIDRACWQQAEEIFTISSFGGVMAVLTLDGEPVGDGEPGPVSRRAAGLYAAEVRGHVAPPG